MESGGGAPRVVFTLGRLPPMPRILLLVLCTLALVVASAPSTSGQETIIELTNADIVTMVRAKLPPELIIAKIKSSRCRFDTFPTVLSELKYKGVSDEVLMAMVQAPVGAPQSTGENSTQVTKQSVSRPVGIATGSNTQLTPRTEPQPSNIRTDEPPSHSPRPSGRG